jgi:hypothetical protein
MKTDDLIAVLAADNRAMRPPVARTAAVAFLLGGAASFAVLLATLGVRPDFAEAVTTWRFDLKVTLAALAFMLGFAECVRLARPGSVNSRHSVVTWVVSALLLAAVVTELVVIPADAWGARLVGTNATPCVLAIPLLALAPLASGLFAIRAGAARSPTLAGAAVGFASAMLAATLYALHCFDDSPLFVATWYTLASLPVVAMGALIGRRVLRW